MKLNGNQALAGEKHFMYKTTIFDTRFKQDERLATICCLHGFSRHAANTFFESGITFALNGFEVVMIDNKGYGYSSGTRHAGFSLFEIHEFYA